MGLAGLTGLALNGPVAAAEPFANDRPYDWTGFFAGLTTGAGYTTVKSTDTGRGPSGPWYVTGASVNDEGAGFIGGVRAGYNHAFGALVVGIEADISAANINQEVTVIDLVGTTDIDWLATVRGRAGVQVPNTIAPVLVYGTGGLAIAGIEHGISDTNAAAPFGGLLGPNTARQTRTGYTVGGGVEMAVTDRAVLGFEYLYSDFGRTSVNGVCVVCFGGGTPGTPYVFDFDTKVHTIRANFSWKFGG